MQTPRGGTMLDSKYHQNLHLSSEATIEVEVTSPTTGKTISKRETNKGKKQSSTIRKNHPPAGLTDSPKSGNEAADSSFKLRVGKNAAAFNFTRTKDQNLTGFTHGSVETGMLGSSTNVAAIALQKQSTADVRKGTVLPDISLVQSFYNSPGSPKQ